MKIVLTFFLLYQAQSVYAQNCLPNSSMFLEKSQITTNGIKNCIAIATKKNYEQMAVQAQIEQIDLCNQEMKSTLDSIYAQIKKNSSLKKELSQYLSVEGLTKQLQEQIEAKSKIKEQLKRDFALIERAGLFVAIVKNFPEMSENKELQDRAHNSILTKAIEDINGTNIKRITKIENYSQVKDVIEAFTSGDLKEIDNFDSKPNYRQNYLLYISKVGVTPKIQVRISGNKKEILALDKNVKIINIMAENSYKSILKKLGVINEDITNLEKTIKSEKTLIDAHNKEADNLQVQYLSKANTEVETIDRTIEKINHSIADRDNKISAICSQLDIQYVQTNPTQSAEHALRKIEENIAQLTYTWQRKTEDEIFYEATSMPFPVEENPIEDISKKVFEIYKSINIEKGQIRGLETYTKIENLKVTSNRMISSTTIYRVIDKIWIYPVPQDNSSYRITVFAKFKIIAEKPLTDKELEQKNKKEKEEAQKQVDKQKRIDNRQKFISSINYLNFQYHIATENPYYNLIDLGVRWGILGDFGVVGGASVGSYWNNTDKRGVCFTGSGALVLYDFAYVGCDVKAAFGKGSFYSTQWRLGLTLKGFGYFTVGKEYFSTNEQTVIGQLGFNIPIH